MGTAGHPPSTGCSCQARQASRGTPPPCRHVDKAAGYCTLRDYFLEPCIPFGCQHYRSEPPHDNRRG